MKRFSCLLLLLFITTTAVTAQKRPARKNAHKKHAHVQYGTASYYANKFQGRPMAGGEPYDRNKMTCAHNFLPMGTWLKVTNLKNKRSVLVRVTDRLHYRNNRVVDLSGIAASKLGYTARGLAHVKVEVLSEKPSRQ